MSRAAKNKTRIEDTPPFAEVLTTQQASKYLKLSPALLMRWRKEGKGPRFVNLAGEDAGKGMIRYRRADLDWFLAQHTTEMEQ